MPDSVYKVITLVGTSTVSWEKAATNAVEKASKTLCDLRIAEVEELDMQIEGGKVRAYRAKVKVSFKYEGKQQTTTVETRNLEAKRSHPTSGLLSKAVSKTFVNFVQIFLLYPRTEQQKGQHNNATPFLFSLDGSCYYLLVKMI